MPRIYFETSEKAFRALESVSEIVRTNGYVTVAEVEAFCGYIFSDFELKTGLDRHSIGWREIRYDWYGSTPYISHSSLLTEYVYYVDFPEPDRIKEYTPAIAYEPYTPRSKTESEPEDKMVSHPPHYQSETGLEAIDVIEAFTFDLKGIEATDTGNVLKYMCRWKSKNGLQDLKKAKWYLEHLINHVEKLEKEND